MARRLSALLTRAQDGDRDAYELFLRETAGLVRGYVRVRMRRPEDAEDVVQDVLLAVHRHRHTYDPGRPLAPWLYAIVRHRLFDARRRQQRRDGHELLEGSRTHDASRFEELPALAWVAPTGLPERLTQALDLLSRTQREVIELLKIEGYSVAEIAQKTGRTPAAVKVTAHRGYKLLRKALTRREP